MEWQEDVKRWRILRVKLGGEGKKLEGKEVEKKVEEVGRENDRDGLL